MTIVSILLGLLGLGIVVFFHELGHFAAARLVGVEVEEFSIGWGPKLTGFTHGTTRYRLSVFPIGGFCRMKGEDSYRKAIEQNLEEFPRDPGSYFTAHPLKRIAIALGGPALNVVFAFVVFAMIGGFGYSVKSWGNRVVLASDYEGGSYAADAAGLRTGDAIVSIDGREVRSFSDIQESFALSAGRQLNLVLDRNGQNVQTAVIPLMDKETGAGKVGVYPWIDPVVDSVSENGPARLAGIVAGDVITSVDGQPIRHIVDLMRYLETGNPERPVFAYSRSGEPAEAMLVLSYDATGSTDPGLSWKQTSVHIQSAGLFGAIADGFHETIKTIGATYRGLASLFMGVDALKAVSGPARITWIVGQVASESFATGMGSGLSVSFNFLAILSIGLFAMNLLPIPLLDGGWILLFLIEALRGKAAKVKTVLRYQTIGVVVVAGLFLFATLGDILFFSGR
ncbi:MAG: RIP metalloprotease RseP [Spirochaetales bacterium]|nr:MAG: RIP metalloprotease RseP [Spirochaetales bacterium]